MARLSSKNQVTIPKRVVDALGLESGDELVLEVRKGEIALKVPEKIEGPTRSLYGSVRVMKPGEEDVIRSVREIRARGGRSS